MKKSKMYRYPIGLIALVLLANSSLFAQRTGKIDAIYSGLPWYDQDRNVVSAHGANIVKDNGKFYLFGEVHSDTSNAFVGFNCYSSKDLYEWKFESIALPVQNNGKLGPNRVGERVKVMKNPKSGGYFMFMHVDTLGYKDQFVGYATSNNITGPYQFKGPLLFNGKAIKKWDMGVFQDKDGTGYILVHGGIIYKLADDYKSIIAETNKQITSGFESPTLFRKNDTYYFIGSNLTSWEKNDNYYYTATSLSGPWVSKGLLAPKGKLTWNSQSTFVLPIEGSKDTTFMFMGDRWSFPKQHSSATYVWQPITVSGNSISIPTYQNAWQVNTSTGVVSSQKAGMQTIGNTSKLITYKGNWQHGRQTDSVSISKSDDKNASASIIFKGKQIGFYSLALPDNGYASVVLYNKEGTIILKNVVDLYAKVPSVNLVYLTPYLPNGEYKLTITVMGERPNWSDKSKTVYGSTGNFISLNKFIINR